jgi:cytidylate kinase
MIRLADEFPGTKLIALAGPVCAGKGEGGKHLAAKHGFMHISTGDMLREEAEERGIKDIGRTSLMEVAVDLRLEYKDPAVLVVRSVDKWIAQRAEFRSGLVVDSHFIRAETETMMRSGAQLLYITADVSERHKRLLLRQRDPEVAISFAEFTAFDEQLQSGTAGPDMPDLGYFKDNAHATIVNNRTRLSFLHTLDKTVGIPASQ